ncbi:hypothetical protein ABI59_08280 [Acidobacteria bacterium Mor1]|nr:hypothetical protein ABI59_08280 [Acidobacteria bacterium Mor1]
MLMALLIGFGIALIPQIIINLLLTSLLNGIPEQYRRTSPLMIWLLLVPCVNLILGFFVYPKLPESFRAYFDAQGDQSHGDCGQTLGWAIPILFLTAMIPYLGCVTAIVGLVILIVYMIKLFELKKLVQSGSSTSAI